MTIQFDFPKSPRLDDMSINAVAMMVVSRAESSKARHNLQCGQLDFFRVIVNPRKNNKPEVPSLQDSFGIIIRNCGRFMTILFCGMGHR